MDTKKANGFTLLELMIVIAVMAVIAAAATNLYQKSVIKANRTALETGMTQCAQKLASYKLVNNSYSVALSSVCGSSVYPTTGTALYDLTLDTSVAGAWTLTAAPKSGTKQAGDGGVLLNDQGWRCWTKSATTCTLSSTSTW